MALRREVLRDLVSRLVVCVLFALLSMNLLRDFLETGRITGLLLLVSEFLIVVVTLIRRPARLVDRTVATAAITAVSLMGPYLVRRSIGDGLVPDAVSATILALGLSVVIVAKVTLGRSFGLVPANRGVVVGGPYAMVRHPIYFGYIITHLAVLLAFPTAWNILALVTADTALVLRALREERVLKGDAVYQAYCGRVGWHLVPGVF